MHNVLPFPGAPFTTGSDRVELNVPEGTLPEGVRALAIYDADTDDSDMDENPARKHDFEVGAFLFVGIVLVRDCLSCGQPQMSPGLWGIESDSGDEYLLEIVRDELSELEAIERTHV